MCHSCRTLTDDIGEDHRRETTAAPWDVANLFQPKEHVPVPKPPVADHLVCMACGAHIEHGFMVKHYASVHPDTRQLIPADEDYPDGYWY